MGRPDFLIPGASKAGTTSLYYYLKEHDRIYLPGTKGLHFFDRDVNYSKGIEHYESEFGDVPDGTLAGEISPPYFYHGKVWDETAEYMWRPNDDPPLRIRDAYPDIKLIFSLRNPATRAYSQYWKNYRQGYERVSFGEALREEIEGERMPEESAFCWIYSNEYTTHIGHWLDLFDSDQMMFLIFEEWVNNPDDALNDICSFLGIESKQDWLSTDERMNTGGTPRFAFMNRFYQDYLKRTMVGRVLRDTGITDVVDALNSSEGYPEMGSDEKALVRDVFLEDIRELEDMIDQDLNVWIDEL